MQIYYFDEDGNLSGEGTSATLPDSGATELVPNSSEDTWNGTEWIAPPEPTEEELAQKVINDWKVARAEAVANIKVTTTAGNEFDGDETSQTRMARAISVMSDTDSTIWVLANNIPTMVSKAELIEALKLSGEAQTALWVAP